MTTNTTPAKQPRKYQRRRRMTFLESYIEWLDRRYSPDYDELSLKEKRSIWYHLRSCAERMMCQMHDENTLLLVLVARQEGLLPPERWEWFFGPTGRDDASRYQRINILRQELGVPSIETGDWFWGYKCEADWLRERLRGYVVPSGYQPVKQTYDNPHGPFPTEAKTGRAYREAKLEETLTTGPACKRRKTLQRLIVWLTQMLVEVEDDAPAATEEHDDDQKRIDDVARGLLDDLDL